MFYVYRITNKIENKHYYGSRVASNCTIEDLGVTYFSSSKNQKFIDNQKDNFSNYKYKIIKVFDNAADTIKYESLLHHKFNVKNNHNFYNDAIQNEDGADFFTATRKCEYCDSEITLGNYKRWHGENCSVLDNNKTFDHRMKYFPYMKRLRNKETLDIEWINIKFPLFDATLYSTDLKEKRTKIKTDRGNITINIIDFDPTINAHVNAKDWVILDSNNNIINRGYTLAILLKDYPSSLLSSTYSAKCSITFLHEKAQLNYAVKNNYLKYEGYKIITYKEYLNKDYISYDKARINKILMGRNNYTFIIYNSLNHIITRIPSIVFDKIYNLKIPFVHMKNKNVNFNKLHSSYVKMVENGYLEYENWYAETVELNEDDICVIEKLL